MVGRASAQGPMEQTTGIGDGPIIDRGDPQTHQPRIIELPILVSIRAVPVSAVFAPLICKSDGDPIVLMCPHLLDEPIVQLSNPFAG